MALMGTSEGKCDEGHPQLPEPHHPCCEKQKELPPRMQGIRYVGWIETHSLSAQCPPGLWQLCPSDGNSDGHLWRPCLGQGGSWGLCILV